MLWTPLGIYSLACHSLTSLRERQVFSCQESEEILGVSVAVGTQGLVNRMVANPSSREFFDLLVCFCSFCWKVEVAMEA